MASKTFLGNIMGPQGLAGTNGKPGADIRPVPRYRASGDVWSQYFNNSYDPFIGTKTNPANLKGPQTLQETMLSATRPAILLLQNNMSSSYWVSGNMLSPTGGTATTIEIPPWLYLILYADPSNNRWLNVKVTAFDSLGIPWFQCQLQAINISGSGNAIILNSIFPWIEDIPSSLDEDFFFTAVQSPYNNLVWGSYITSVTTHTIYAVTSSDSNSFSIFYVTPDLSATFNRSILTRIAVHPMSPWE